MSTQAAPNAGPTRIDQSDSSFEKEFGLEANVSNSGEDAAEPVAGKAQLRELMDHADDIDDETGAEDNLDRLDRKAARKKARDTRPAIDAELVSNNDAADEGEDDDEDLEDPDAEDAPEKDEEADDEAAEDEEQEGEAPKLTAEKAQAALDRLLEEFGDKLEVSFSANGEERRATMKQLREEHAPGYMGQEGVSRTFNEAKRIREEGEAARQEAATAIKETQQELLDYVQKKPLDFIRDFVLPYGGAEAVRGMHDALARTVEQMESDPGTFELRQQVFGLQRTIEQLVSGGQAAKAEPAAPAADRRDTTAPGSDDPYGFIPGPQGGYPPATQRGVQDSLKRLSGAHGIPYETVVARWNERGRDVPIFGVLDQMVATKAADQEKARLAAKPPTKPAPKGEGKIRSGKKRSTRRLSTDEELEQALFEYAEGAQKRAAAR
jgi:hypothetical protein